MKKAQKPPKTSSARARYGSDFVRLAKANGEEHGQQLASVFEVVARIMKGLADECLCAAAA